MACFHPLIRNSFTGVVMSGASLLHVGDQMIPCGQCIGCRLERSRQWAVRCLHEASLYEENCFVTLTYSDEHLPAWGSLDKSAFPKFMKRLRKSLGRRKVRFFHAGEYGDRFGRPHYHACLFGIDFADKVPWTTRGDFPVWRSPTLERLWPFGNSELGSVTFESAAYVARYIMKKVTGKAADDHYISVDDDGVIHRREREYTTMSRRPGVGKPWFDRYYKEVYDGDGVLVRGTVCKPPRFYDLALAEINPSWAELVCSARRRKRKREDETPARLEVREACVKARVTTFLKRGLE